MPALSNPVSSIDWRLFLELKRRRHKSCLWVLTTQVTSATGESIGYLHIFTLLGKSTLINYMKPEGYKRQEIVPTIGYSVEQFSVGRINFTVFDMSGQGKSRALWEHYYRDAHAVIFVVDSTDRLRMEVAREELNNLLQHVDVATRKAGSSRPIELVITVCCRYRSCSWLTRWTARRHWAR